MTLLPLPGVTICRLRDSGSGLDRNSTQLHRRGAGQDQGDLFGGPGLPPGLLYRPDVLDPALAAALLAALPALPVQPFAFHGFEGRRRVASFGWRYDFSAARLQRAGPLPAFLLPARAAAAALAGLPADRFVHALVTEYAPGAAIGWHRDRPDFATVVGLSLGAPCRLRLRRRRPGGGWDRAALALAPRSGYVLDGPARHEWEHSIPPVDALRYSLTFRTLAAQGA
jgi:alkylated DNA repair dioxygenase AlkB